jgi:glutaryl-CoA dehydrogenase
MNFNRSENEQMIAQMVRDFAEKEIRPNYKKWDDEEHFPVDVMKKMGELGLLGIFIPEEYGGSGFGYFEYATALMELGKVCGGIGLSVAAHNSLCTGHIYYHGSEEQKKKYLPKLATGDLMGCFGLTEPDHGSNPNGMITNFKDKGDHYLLNGAKMWISNSPFADIAVVWAKDEAGEVRGLIVERGYEGFTTPETHGKWSLRASATGELVFDNVKVPKENLLPNVKGLKGPLGCLNSARFGIAWGVIGAAMDCYDSALRYSKERIQFGKPIGAFQLTQKKLAEMITEITKAQLLTFRLGQLKNENRATPAQISMAKRNNVNMALQIAREARQIHGGMGITGEYPIMRHMMNLESVITYEGTHDIHLLITGMDVTGFNAFN